MTYRIMPTGEIWNGGVFCVPKIVAESGLYFASELQVKVLLVLLSNSGSIDVKTASEMLKVDEYSIEEALEYWINEGVITKDCLSPVKPEAEAKPEPEIKKPLEALPVPNLTPRDIIALCDEQPELKSLLRGAEKTLSSSLSNALKSNVINMVTYYGLPVPVVLTLLEYYKTERDAGKSITTRTLQNMAKDWASEGIDSLDAASAKLQELAGCDELWGDVINLCKFEYRKPTSNQRKMLLRWRGDFGDEMIFFACNTMKKYTEEEKQSLKIVDNILKDWKRRGFKTPDDVKAAPPKETAKKPKDNRLKGKPTFDIDEINRRSLMNDDFDI